MASDHPTLGPYPAWQLYGKDAPEDWFISGQCDVHKAFEVGFHQSIYSLVMDEARRRNGEGCWREYVQAADDLLRSANSEPQS